MSVLIVLILLALVTAQPACGFSLFKKVKAEESPIEYSKKDFRRLFGFLKGECRDGWQALVENDLSRAKDKFKSALKRNAFDTFAWEGISVAALEEGDYQTLQRAWLEILDRTNSSLQMEATLRRLWLYRAYLPNPAIITERVQNLVQQSQLPTICGILAAEIVFNAHRSELNIGLATEILPDLGYVSHWDYVVGPFGNSGAADLDYAFEPEWDSFQPAFKSFSRELQKQPVPKTGLAPGLDFDSLLFPKSGTAYACTTFSVSPEEERAILRFVARNPLKLWLNGTLICAFDPRRESGSPEFILIVKLNPGPNQFFVKSLRAKSNWSFSPQLLDFSGRGLNVIPADPASLDPTSTTLRRRNVPDISAAIPLQLSRVPPEAGNFFDHFYLYEIFQARENHLAALEEIELIEDLLPSTTFVKNRVGFLRLFDAGAHPESFLRLCNQAREAFDAALKIDDKNVMANLGKGLFYYLQSKPDLAIESFEKVIALQQDDHIAHYQLGKIAMNRGWKKEALNYLKRARSLVPRNADVLLTLAGFYESAGDATQAYKLLEEAMTSGFTDDGMVRRAAELAYRRKDYRRAVELYDKLLVAYPSNLELRWKKINALILQEQLSEARKAVERAMKINPANPFGFQVLAQLAIKDSRTTDALSLYEEALKRDPSNASTREKLALFRDIKPFYEKFDTSYSETLSAEHTAENFPRSSVVWLVDVAVVDVHDDLSYQTMTHQAIKILNAQGRRQWDELRLPGTAADVLWVRTVLPDGTRYEPVSVQQAEGQLLVSMYGIAEDAVVDFAYLTNSGEAATPWQNHIYEGFLFRQINDPVALSRLVVITPEGVEIDFRNHPMEFEPEIRSLDDGRSAYVWEKRDIAPIKHEPYQPPLGVLAPSVDYTTYPSWKNAVERIRASFFVRYEADRHLKATVLDIISNTKSEYKRLSAIYDYISTNIKSGASGGTPIDTFYLKTGHYYEKLQLARLMLFLAGIRSHLCLQEEPPDVIETIDLPASFRFPQVALFIPSLDGKPFAFTFQSRFRPLRNLLETSERMPFLLLEDDHAYFQNLIYRENEESWRTNEIKVGIQADGKASIRGTIWFYGQQNPTLRNAFDDPNTRRLMLDQAPLQLFKNLEDAKSEAKNVESLDKPLSIEFSGIDSKLIERSGDLLQFLPCERKLNLSTLITGETRETPIQLEGSVVEQTDRIHFTLPEDYRIKALPEDYLDVSPFGTYSLVLVNRDTEIEVIRTVDMKSLEVKEEEFPLLVRFCRSIDEAEDRKIVLERFR